MSHSVDEKEDQFTNKFFSTSTDWSYLYILGKMLIKYKLDLKNGVTALSGCIEIMEFLCENKSQYYYRAKYWIGYALLVAGYKKEAESIIKEIGPFLNGKYLLSVKDIIKSCHTK